jgi:hypothetical protein
MMHNKTNLRQTLQEQQRIALSLKMRALMHNRPRQIALRPMLHLLCKIRRLKLRPMHPQQRRTNRQLRLLIKTSLRVTFLPLPKLRLETAMQRTLVKPRTR